MGMPQLRLGLRLSLITLPPVAYTISVDSAPGCLTVTVAGPAPFAESCGLAALVAELVRARGHRRVLADLTAAQPQLSFTEHLRYATLVVDLLGRLDKLAVVVPPGYGDAPAARAAQLAGLRVKTFLRMGEARDWLAAGGALPQEPVRRDGVRAATSPSSHDRSSSAA